MRTAKLFALFGATVIIALLGNIQFTHAADDCGGVLPYSGSVPAGEYNLTSDCYITGTLVISGSVTINGNGYAIDGNNTYRIFQVTFGTLPSVNLTIDNITLRNGAAGRGGAIEMNASTAVLTISNSTFLNNSADTEGGALFIYGREATITNSTFSNNSANTRGGAILNFMFAQPLNIIDSTFTGNSADSGDAIYNLSSAEIGMTHFENNTCTGTGTYTDNGGNTVVNAEGCPGDMPAAGITVGAVSATSMDEGGGDVTFTVTLDSAPSDWVEIPISVNDATECEIVSAEPIFVRETDPVTVRVEALNDYEFDADQPCNITLGTTRSSDPAYDGLDPDDRSFTVVNIEIPEIIVDPLSGTIPEGENGQFSIELATDPTGVVEFDITVDDPTECSVSPTRFSASDKRAIRFDLDTVRDYTEDGDQPCNITLGVATSTGTSYNGMNPDDLSITVRDVDRAEVRVSPSGSTNLNEDGSQMYIFTLGTIPTDTVTFPVRVNSAQCTVNATEVALDSGNWNTGVSVTVSGVSETVTDGNRDCSLLTDNVTGTSDYVGMNPPNAGITVIDDDTPGYVMDTLPASVSENGGSGSITVRLANEPDADVTLDFSAGGADACTLTSAASHTFNAGNFGTPVTVSVAAVDDVITDGNATCTLSFTAMTSASGYTALGDPAAQHMTVIDDEAPGYMVSAWDENPIDEDGGTASFTIRLNTAPDNDVEIQFDLVDDTFCTLTSAASHVFNDTNYGTNFTVSVEAINDGDVTGDRDCTVTMSAGTAATGYDTLGNPADKAVTVIDDDIPGVTGEVVDDGDDDVFTQQIEIHLRTQPLTGERVTVSFENLPPEVRVSPETVTFDETNWNTPVTLRIVTAETFTGDINEALSVSFDSTGGDYAGLSDYMFDFAFELIPPPPPPMLNEWMGEHEDETRGHAYGMPDGVYGNVYMWQGAWEMVEQGLPQSLVDYGVILAVDVWVYNADGSVQFDFGGYQQICLLGEGRMIFMDATQSPRTMWEMDNTTFEDGYTCGWIPNAGTVVLIEAE